MCYDFDLSTTFFAKISIFGVLISGGFVRCLRRYFFEERRYNVPKENLPDDFIAPVDDGKPLGITDDYMFYFVMQDEAICTRFLQEFLPDWQIKQVKTQMQRQYKHGRKSKAIRVDVQATDDRGRLFDIEMQRDNEFQHKRIRYYRAVIDLNSLKVSQDYDKLPPAVIIILSPFDSFAGRSEKVYFFQTVCRKEGYDIVLNDESLVFVVNSRGTVGSVSPTMQKFLDLMNGVADTSDDFIKAICDKMSYYNHDAQWRKDRMEYQVTLNHERNIGEKRGIEIGEERNLIQNLRYLVESGMSPDEAMVRLKVPSEKREEYRKLIEPQKV